jgi:iron complex transport system substrate-binding protein
MLGCRSLARSIVVTALAGCAMGLGWAATPRVQVAAEVETVFAALAGAYAPGVEAATDGVDLVLALGAMDVRTTNAVAVTPDALLSLVADTPEARAFMRFAASPAGQRALIDAGLLPSRVTISDQDGRTIELEQPVERIFSPYALATFMVYVVGGADRLLVGNYLGARDPEGAAAMTRIDPGFPERSRNAPEDTTNAEFVATLSPDLVLASSNAPWTDPVEALGVSVIGFEGESIERLRDAMRILGLALGPDAAARAEAWIAYYDGVLEAVARSTSGVASRPSVLFTGTERTRVASGAMYQSALIEAAGGRSVTAHLGGSWNDVDVEQVATWNPDLILVAPYGRASVAAIVEDREWQLLDAVRAGEVVRVPKLVAPWDTPVPDSVLGLVWLAQTLHGELTGLSCERETAFFYRRFYDYPISDEEVAALCQR